MNKTKYNVGDKVKLKDDLIGGQTYDTVYFAKNMENLLGKHLALLSIVTFDNPLSAYGYRVKDEDIDMTWTINDEMIEELVEDVDKIRINLKDDILEYHDHIAYKSLHLQTNYNISWESCFNDTYDDTRKSKDMLWLKKYTESDVGNQSMTFSIDDIRGLYKMLEKVILKYQKWEDERIEKEENLLNFTEVVLLFLEQGNKIEKVTSCKGWHYRYKDDLLNADEIEIRGSWKVYLCD